MRIGAQAQETLRAYRLFFSSPEGMEVLRNLMQFCKFCLPIAGQVDEGKRQVFLHILEFSQLSDEQLLELYAGRLSIQPTEPHDERDTSGDAAGAS